MNDRQAAVVKRLQKAVLHHDGLGESFGGEYEYKRFEVSESEGLVFVNSEVGRVDDEATLAAILCRKHRHFAIGPRGGVELLNAKNKHRARGFCNALTAEPT